MRNALSIDVEDWFQVSCLEGAIDRHQWDQFPLRVEANVDLLLHLCAAADVRATFFILGWIAERLPETVRQIAMAGHEIGSHGLEHHRAHDLSHDAFRRDVARSKAMLEDIAGVRVEGYRAPSFSINAGNRWAYEVLADEGYLYSSSVAPFAHDHYGWPGSPRFAWRPIEGTDFLEIPVSTSQIGSWHIPAGGGGFFRLYPYAVSHALLRRINAEGKPGVFYLHPWEIDPVQPPLPGTSWKARWRHTVNRKKTRARLARLLRDLNWTGLHEIAAQERERCS